MPTAVSASASAPEPTIGDSALQAIRGVFHAADYTPEGIAARLKLEDLSLAPAARKDVPKLLYRLQGEDPLDVLIALFLLNVVVGRGVFESAIGPTSAEQWEEAGLVRFEGDRVLAVERVTPIDRLLIATDTAWHPKRTTDPGLQVMSVSGSTEILHHLMVRRPGARVLDLGTGSGALALLAAASASSVVGIDLNPFAIERARFNARFNGVTNARWEVGDWFAPVEGEQFELIVTNPPFVISPESTAMYRDSGRPLDSLCAELVGRIPPYLAPGGFAQVLCNWAVRRGDGPYDRLRGWTENTGCDAFTLVMKVDDPADYAVNWLCQGEPPPAEEYQKRFTAWMQHYQDSGIEAIGYGLLTLRRPVATQSDRRPWFYVGTDSQLAKPFGDVILRAFDRYDFLAQTDDSRLLATRLRTAPAFAWDQTVRPRPQGWELVRSRLRLDAGLSYTLDAGATLATLLAACRGDRPVGQVMAEIAARFGEDPNQYARANLPALRSMLEMGFLDPLNDVTQAGPG